MQTGHHVPGSSPSLERRPCPLASLTLVLAPLALGALGQAAAAATAGQGIRLVHGPATPAGGTLAGTFTTIQAAVNAAANGDTVLIPAGVYTGPGNFNVLVNNKNLTITGEGQGQTIVDCQGQGRGFEFAGALVTSACVLQSLTIENGTGAFGGGIVLGVNASPSLRDLEIRFCSATSGGAIFGFDGTVWHADGLFLHDNDASQSGGAISMTMPEGTVQNCLVEDNTSGIVGAGLSISNTPGLDGQPGVRISDTVFRGNFATCCGGAFYSEFADSYFVDRCTFLGNSANDGGGAIEVVGDLLAPSGTDVVFFQNSLVARNSAASGGGMRSILGSLIVQNCTIADNSASVHTGGLLAAGDGLFLLNTILWGNVSPDSSVQVQQLDFIGVNPGLRLIFFNDVEGSPPDPTSISADPLFVAPRAGNYHIGVGSPCINAGLTINLVLAQRDIDGQARVQGNGIDMGADERVTDTRPVVRQASSPQSR